MIFGQHNFYGEGYLSSSGRSARRIGIYSGARLVAPILLALLVLAGCAGSSGTVRRATPGAAVWTATPKVTNIVSGDPSGDWLQFGFDATRSGVNPTETVLTTSTVANLHRIYQISLPGVADSSPALLHGVAFPDGATRDVLFITTRDGRILALDAANGAILWSHRPHGPKITHSSPVISPDGKYVFAYGLDGFLHKYAVVSGDEVIGAGWPVRITLMTQTEKDSSSLNIADGNVYVVTSGYIGDAPPYQGHIVTINAATGANHVFNSLCSNISRLLSASDCASEQSGIWARGGAVVDPVTGDIFATTGNGPYTGNTGGHDWGDTILELSSDGSRLLDSYTPDDYQHLQDYDIDLGSVSPALLPTLPHSKTPYLLVQGGKDALLRLINRQNMSGAGKPGYNGGELQSVAFPGCGVFAQPTVWTDPTTGVLWVLVAGTCGFGAYQVVTDSSGVTQLHLGWKSGLSGATSPVLANGVLYVALSGKLLAFDPTSGKTLWSSALASAGGSIGAIHWESPIVVGGKVYSTDEGGHLTVYGL